MKPVVAGLLVTVLAACAVLSDVTAQADGSFLTAAHSNDVNGRVDEQKAKVTERADAFCAQRQARVEVVRLVALPPPPGQPPVAQLEFRCVGGAR